MNDLHAIPTLCGLSSSRAILAELIQQELLKNSKKQEPTAQDIVVMRLKFLLKSLYMNGKVENTIAMKDVLRTYKELIGPAIKYLKDFHSIQDKELFFVQEQAKHVCPVLGAFEKEATTINDLQRYRESTGYLIIDIVS